jgi:hypothetical protein
MGKPEAAHDHGGVPPIVWKVLIPAASGGAVYLVSNLTRQSQEWSLLLSVFVGGVALVVQFLIDFDRGLRDVQKRFELYTSSLDDTVWQAFRKINAATEMYSTIEASPVGSPIRQLIQDVHGLTTASPHIALRLARSEIDRLAHLLREISEGQATYDGEDQDWLLALANGAKESIDATSTTAVDGGGATYQDNFWTSSLGQRYLGAQRDAANRGVIIRRLFILNPPSLAVDPEFQKIYRMQTEVHISARILDPSKIPTRRISSLFDFILFDDLMSYEAIAATRLDPSVKPCIISTQLIARQHHVRERRDLFDELWSFGRELD